MIGGSETPRNLRKRRTTKIMSIQSKTVSKAKDELEFATNWRRVFIEIYQQFKWLNSFATINNLAMQKILKKFMKEHFEMKDNVVDKKIKDFISEKEFSHKQQLHFAITDMVDFFAEHFTHNGSKDYARKILES